MSYDPLDPLTEEERRRQAEIKAAKMCPECCRVTWKGHFPWCSEAPIDVQERWAASHKPRRRR